MVGWWLVLMATKKHKKRKENPFLKSSVFFVIFCGHLIGLGDDGGFGWQAKSRQFAAFWRDFVYIGVTHGFSFVSY
jgi:hypothetical protein